MTKPTPLFRGAYTTGKVELDRILDQVMDAVNDVRGQGGASETTGDRRTSITVVGGAGTTGESAGAQRILNNSGVPVPKGVLAGQTATGTLGLAMAGTLAAQLVATETAAPGAWMPFAQTGLVSVLVEAGVTVGAGETAYLSGAEAGRATNTAPGTPQRIGVFQGTAASSGLVLLLVDGLGGAGGGEHDAVTLDTPADTVLSLTEQVIGLDTQTANKVFAGPETGAAAVPTMRALVDADIPAAIARDSEVSGAISTHAAIATAHHTNANDPSAGEKAALAGTSGTPGAENKYVTNADARNTDARTPAAHVLVSGSHTASALTAGHFLKALTETTFGFAAHGLGYSDVGASASGHNHDAAYLGIGAKAADADKLDGVDSTGYATSGHGHSHTALTDIGTNTHAQIDTFIGTKAAASGLASLDGSSKVVQDPANATATPTQNKIPIADGAGGTLALGWLPATLTGKTATPAAHALTNSVHAETGLTTGHFLKATSATAFGFGAHGLGYSDVGAAAASHAHAIGDLPTAAVGDGDTTHVPTCDGVYDAIAAAGGHAAVTLDANADSLLSLSTQALGLDTQIAARVLAGPATGDPAVPTFRALATTDIPTLDHGGLSGLSDDDHKAYQLWKSDHSAAALTADAAGALTAIGTFTWGAAASVLSSVLGTGTQATLDPAGDIFNLYDNTNTVKKIRLWWGGANYLSIEGASAASTTSSCKLLTYLGHLNLAPASTFVGVNTAAPTVALDVTGAAKISSTLNAGATTLAGTLAMGANAITSTGTISSGIHSATGLNAQAPSVDAGASGSPALISTISSVMGAGSDISAQVFQSAVQTTNATETTLMTVPIPQGRVSTIEVVLNAVDTDDTTKGIGCKMIATYTNSAGTAVLIGLTEVHLAESLYDCVVSMDASGANARIRVTGLLGRAIKWIATATRHAAYVISA